MKFFLIFSSILLYGTTANADLTFFKRLFSYPLKHEITDVHWYDPQEGVIGSYRDNLVSGKFDLIEKSQLEKVRAYARERNSSALIVAYQNRILLEEYWQGFSRTSQSNSNSMAKTIVGLLVGRAIDDGFIGSENDLISTYLPNWKSKGEASLRIKHLLNMSASIAFNDNVANPFSELWQMHLGSDIPSVVFGSVLGGIPGQNFQYSNCNTQLLSLLIEKVTGKRYAEYLSETLWSKIGAGHASVWLDRPGGTAKTYCCLFASARDWVKVGLLLLNKGEALGKRIVSSDWINKMTTPSSIEPGYGYLTWLGNSQAKFKKGGFRKAKFLAEDTFFLDGGGKQRVYVMPSQGLIVVRIGDRAPDWDDSFIPNTLMKGLRPGRR